MPESEAPSPEETPKRHSGRRVVLVLLILLPIVIVPLLLSGWGSERQVDLVTLQQRERRMFLVGSFALSQDEWGIIDEWPQYEWRRRLPPELTSPPSMKPSEYAALADPNGSIPHRWVTMERSMPFAMIFPIRNQRALSPANEDAVALRMAAVSVLNPETELGRDCLRRLTENMADPSLILVGDELVEPERRRRRGGKDPGPAEKYARFMVEQLADLRGQQVRESAAEMICSFVPAGAAPASAN